MSTAYVTPDDCKSDLGKRMQSFRADRPSEWLMDDFIAEVEAMHERIVKLEFMIENGLGYEDLERDI